MILGEKKKYNWFGEILILSFAILILYNGVKAITSIGFSVFFSSIFIFGVFILWPTLFIFRELYFIINNKFDYIEFTNKYIEWNYGFFLGKKRKINVNAITEIKIDASTLRLGIKLKSGVNYNSMIWGIFTGRHGPSFLDNAWELEVKLKKKYPQIEIIVLEDHNN